MTSNEDVTALVKIALMLSDEAYAAKAMPDLGLEVADFQAQTWRIEQWSQQPKRLVGPEFSCGGHKWCVQRGRAEKGGTLP